MTSGSPRPMWILVQADAMGVEAFRTEAAAKLAQSVLAPGAARIFKRAFKAIGTCSHCKQVHVRIRSPQAGRDTYCSACVNERQGAHDRRTGRTHHYAD